MKKMMMVLGALLLTFMIGCGSGSPQEVYEAYCDAIRNEDVDALVECMATENEQAGAMMAAFIIAAVQEAEEKPDFPAVKSVEEKGDTATLTLEDGKTMTCKKIDGEWKMVVDK